MLADDAGLQPRDGRVLRMKARAPSLVCALALCAAACTTTNIVPVDAKLHRLGEVCIERNSRVLIRALVPGIRDAFRRHRVKTVIREPDDLEGCEYVLRYTALQGWDVAPYTRTMELELFQGEQVIGRLDYEHHGGIAVTKYGRTVDKLDPLIDRLLEGQRPKR